VLTAKRNHIMTYNRIQTIKTFTQVHIACTYLFFLWGRTYVTRYCVHFLPIVQPQMIDEGDCGAIGGMKIGRGNRSTRRKSAPAPFCPPQIPLDQTRARTRAAAVGSQRYISVTQMPLGLKFSSMSNFDYFKDLSVNCFINQIHLIMFHQQLSRCS
jgi:hypothetical protein